MTGGRKGDKSGRQPLKLSQVTQKQTENCPFTWKETLFFIYLQAESEQQPKTKSQ